MNRRSAIKLFGGTVGAAMLPLNFSGCDVGEAYARESIFQPTPEIPLTPTDDFYVNWCCGLPRAPEPARWRLHLRGLVRDPVTLTYDDLLALPQVHREVTLECVGNLPGGLLLSSGRFEGPLLRDVLARARLEDAAHGLSLRGLDGYPSYMPRSEAEDDTAMLAHTLNGEPLRVENGAPVRALFPGRYGLVAVKWLDSITATRTYTPYGALRGLGDPVAARMRLRSRIDEPYDGRTVRVGRAVELRGLALAPGRGVSRVQVHADGSWQDAELTFNTLTDERSPYLWSLWRFAWTPRRVGRHVLQVRAFDVDGATQDAHADFPYDSGAIHAVRVVAIEPAA